MMLVAALLSLAVQQPPRKVVFVCEHGTVKSVVALEYFNRMARARHLNVEAISRGTRPDSLVPTPVRRGLTDDGFDLGLFRPAKFSRDDLASAILVVSLDADVDSIVRDALPALPVARWNGLPSVTANYANGRAAIEANVARLIDSLARDQTRRAKAPRRP